MKKNIFLGILLCLNAISYAQINFTDANFKNALLSHNPVIDTNRNGEITIQEAEQFQGHLKISGKRITNANEIKYFTKITRLDISNNDLSSIDLSKNIRIAELRIQLNNLIRLDISRNLNLKKVYCNNNKLTNLITSSRNAVRLRELNCFNNRLQNLDLSELAQLRILKVSKNQLRNIDLTSNQELRTLEINDNRLTALNVTQNSLLSILGFHNNTISSLNVTQNSRLRVLSCNKNRLQNLDITRNTLLEILRIEDNEFTSINTNNNINLEVFRAQTNRLNTLNVSNNVNLRSLYINNNILTDINLTQNTNLTDLIISNNNITSLDVSNCAIKRIDFSNNPEITIAFLSEQRLERDLNTPIGFALRFQGCPKLQLLCLDEDYVTPTIKALGNRIYLSTSTKPVVSSNCNAIISGKVTYDIDNDGCGDADDIPFSNFKFGVSGADGFREVFTNNSGEYITIGNDGINFIFPLLENPEYFDPLTPTAPINFPQEAPNAVRNYCITPNGIHNDLEVTLIPIRMAVPGFNAEYLITYKNKGTNRQSGSIALDFMQNVLTFVSSQPTTTSITTDKLSWNFTNLKPQESREIKVFLKVNRPTDNPSVNSGDILSYKATAIAATDATPDNNVAIFNQTAVNSFDPNDKTCLEGATIEPNDVGNYLHYLIRFENKGTANAINIRVEDDIDTSTLDIESFIPLQASHSYTAMVIDKKKIEFTFSNINLPFDDANNDGYVLFKIKTKDNLVEGDIINNKADIYFDFNPPVITEVETVTVKKKDTPSVPVFTDYFTLSPNPTTGNLTLTPVNTNISVQQITIHDVAGNVVGIFGGTTTNMNVSYLFANTYFMQLHSNMGILTTKFVKIN